MKKFIWVFTCFTLILGLVGAAAAHPPATLDVVLESAGTLKIQVSHTVSDPAKHFINRVVVTRDGKVLAEQSFSKQTDKSGLVVELPVAGLAKGQTIEVEADCNIFGSLRKSVIL